ncbi:MAG TPA: tetratricopeptide repeat protein [Steroidobacteraceae bacterium]|nr:tetratricopeptide repeat protein [Steroidobacteraceae bacterium]
MSRRQARAAKAGHVPRHRAGSPHPSPSPLQQAWALYAGGDRAAAESLCRALLARQAGDVAAMSLLGILLAQSRRTQEAAELLEQVAARSPQDPAAHNNFGNVLKDLGRYLKALSCYDRAIVIKPDYTEAHYNRGVTLHDLGRHDEALASYNRAVALAPNHASAWNNRGATLRALGLREPAVASYDRAIAIRPDYPEAHNGHGVALQEIGRFEEALASYQRAIASRPDYAEAHNNRGAVLRKLERPEEALASLERALAIRSDYAEAHNARGAVLKELERFEEAIESFDRALGIRPDYAEALSNRGSVLRAMKRYPEALASYQRALEIDPNFADAHRNQGAVFIDLKSFDQALASYERALALNQDMASYVAQGAVLHELKRTDEAIASYRRALALEPGAGFLLGTVRHVRMQICDWADLEADVRAISAGLEAEQPLSRPFNFLSLVDSPALQRRASELSVRAEIQPRRGLPPIPRHPRHERIRVGYFSADLRNHPVTILTAELFERHDRSRFDITAFSLGPNVRDEFRARIEPAFDRFLWVGGQSDREIAELSRRLEIDIAVDLGGYTGDARPRIMALRAAPVQVSYLGYLGTMGGEFMDYLIADPIIVPSAARAHYTEKIAYLPSYQINDSKRTIADRVFARAELGLPEAGFVFCCFNASYKITPEVFGCWMRILAAVPGSVLFLLGGNDAKERNLRRQAVTHGIAPERLVFGGRVVNAEYLARYRSADLFLDTLPYNAGTTASDALWAGLPVLTCIGASFAARVAASILTSADLAELVTCDLGQYERLAIELALRPGRLAAIKGKLAQSRTTCPLFDTPTVTRNIESLYARMYERHFAGLPPEHLELP